MTGGGHDSLLPGDELGDAVSPRSIPDLLSRQIIIHIEPATSAMRQIAVAVALTIEHYISAKFFALARKATFLLAHSIVYYTIRKASSHTIASLVCCGFDFFFARYTTPIQQISSYHLILLASLV